MNAKEDLSEFLRATVESPDDDTARLVMADALDEGIDWHHELLAEQRRVRADYIRAVTNKNRRDTYAIGAPESKWLKANHAALVAPLLDMAARGPKPRRRRSIAGTVGSTACPHDSWRLKREGRRVTVFARVPSEKGTGRNVWAYGSFQFRRGMCFGMSLDGLMYRRFGSLVAAMFPEASVRLVAVDQLPCLMWGDAAPTGDYALEPGTMFARGLGTAPDVVCLDVLAEFQGRYDYEIATNEFGESRVVFTDERYANNAAVRCWEGAGGHLFGVASSAAYMVADAVFTVAARRAAGIDMAWWCHSAHAYNLSPFREEVRS